MRKVVSNTTPILSLLKIGQLEILERLYGQITIPHEVYQEIEAGKAKDAYIDLSVVKWVSIEKIKNPKSLSFFMDLD
jgi:uncharacterized protein